MTEPPIVFWVAIAVIVLSVMGGWTVSGLEILSDCDHLQGFRYGTDVYRCEKVDK